MGVAHSGHKPRDVAPLPVISRLAHGMQHRECPQGWNRVHRGASRQMPHSAPSSDPAVACRIKPWGREGSLGSYAGSTNEELHRSRNDDKGRAWAPSGKHSAATKRLSGGFPSPSLNVQLRYFQISISST